MRWLDRVSRLLLRPFSPTMRLVLIKDLTLFRRDPLQWSQFLLFFGLLSFYFIYVRRFDYGRQLTGWMTAIGFMNLGVVGLILSTFTTRFVFPLISIEGQRFWILGTAPIDRRQIIWSKFIFATLVTSLPCCLLVFLSDVALQLWQRTPWMVAVHQLICWMLATGLSALSIGLGARMPDLHETAPAKIAAGFGGTLTLILSALLVIAIVLPPSIPAYLMYTQTTLAKPPGLPEMDFQFYFAVALLSCLAVTSLAVVIPLRVGLRAFERMELI
jgi:ABC-2 type transport system permease protein